MLPIMLSSVGMRTIQNNATEDFDEGRTYTIDAFQNRSE